LLCFFLNKYWTNEVDTTEVKLSAVKVTPKMNGSQWDANSRWSSATMMMDYPLGFDLKISTLNTAETPTSWMS